jgi:hypothetical protein
VREREVCEREIQLIDREKYTVAILKYIPPRENVPARCLPATLRRQPGRRRAGWQCLGGLKLRLGVDGSGSW